MEISGPPESPEMTDSAVEEVTGMYDQYEDAADASSVVAIDEYEMRDISEAPLEQLDAAQVDEPRSTETQSSDLMSSPFLNLTELSPGVTAALRRMMEEKEQNEKKETVVAQLRALIGWDTLTE